MKKLRILESNEVGHGILIETDAGWVSPKESHNALVIQESAKLDYRNMILQIEMVEHILNKY